MIILALKQVKCYRSIEYLYKVDKLGNLRLKVYTFISVSANTAFTVFASSLW